MLQKEPAVLQSVSFLQKLLAVVLKVRGKPVRIVPELTPWLVQRLSEPWRLPMFVKLQAEHRSRLTVTSDLICAYARSKCGGLLASALTPVVPCTCAKHKQQYAAACK
jgi:hypothetical protein